MDAEPLRRPGDTRQIRLHVQAHRPNQQRQQRPRAAQDRPPRRLARVRSPPDLLGLEAADQDEAENQPHEVAEEQPDDADR